MTPSAPTFDTMSNSYSSYASSELVTSPSQSDFTSVDHGKLVPANVAYQPHPVPVSEDPSMSSQLQYHVPLSGQYPSSMSSQQISSPLPISSEQSTNNIVYHGNHFPYGSNAAVPTEESYRPLIPEHVSHIDRLRNENQELKDIAEHQLDMIQQLLQERDVREKLESQLNSVPSYQMLDKKPHGLAIIIGNEHFQKNPQRGRLDLKVRNGCQSDIHNFASCFGFLGYDFHICFDMTSQQIMDTLDKAVNTDHSLYDSFVFCISTHGEENNYIFGSDSKRINVYDLVAKVKDVPSLHGKPKLFFIQACRTESSDLASRDGSPPPSVSVPANTNTDIAIFWATTRSSPAFRSSRDGSWFVAALYKIFTTKADHMDLISMMYLVTDVVAKMEGLDKESDMKAMQCVETNSQLRGTVRFVIQ